MTFRGSLLIAENADVRPIRVFLGVAIDGEVFLAGHQFGFGGRNLLGRTVAHVHRFRDEHDGTIGVTLRGAGFLVLIADDARQLLRGLVLDAERHANGGKAFERIAGFAAATGVAIGHRNGGADGGDLRRNAGRVRFRRCGGLGSGSHFLDPFKDCGGL